MCINNGKGYAMVVIDTNSWHFRLMAKLNIYSRHEDNLCPYVRGVLGALFLCFLGSIVTAFMSASAGDALGWFVSGIINGFYEAPLLGGIFLALLVVVIVFGGIYFLITILMDELPQEKKEKIEAVYESLTGKLCVRIVHH